jgi:acyl carrier protein
MSDAAKDQILGFIKGRYPQAEIGEAEDIFQLGFINSLFAMELVMFVEKAFGVTIPNDELVIDNFRTANAMAALVGRLAPAAALAEA